MTVQLTDQAALPGNGVFARGEHEQIVYCQDEHTELRAIIAIYSTALGPALGGTRFYPYPSEEDALADVLRLSRAMAYKSAIAGLPLGGGKAVIIGDPRRDKSRQLLRAYGRFVQSLAGRYVTACDVGTYATDMDVVATQTSHVTGRSTAHGGCGDSSVLTALGVLKAMSAAAAHLWGSSELAGRRVGVEGAGKVGGRLIGHLVDAGAEVITCDPDERALANVRAKYPQVRVVSDAESLRANDLDIYSPCAMGGSVSHETVPALHASIICGAANNQLAEPSVAQLIAERGVLYVPDYVANAGGLIQVAGEVDGTDLASSRARVTRMYDSTAQILASAEANGVTPSVMADDLAERTIREATLDVSH